MIMKIKTKSHSYANNVHFVYLKKFKRDCLIIIAFSIALLVFFGLLSVFFYIFYLLGSCILSYSI